MSGPRVAVVGAGLAGLAAAVSLQRHGASVHLIERSRLLGGKATSFAVDGIEVDSGQHVTLRCCTEFSDFVGELGMRDSLRFQDRFAVTVLAKGARPAALRASRWPAPLHLAAGFLRYRHLGVSDKARVLRGLVAARRGADIRGTMAQWLRQHGQNAATRRSFWDPFLIPALNAPLERVAAADGLFVIRTAFLGASDAACIGYSTVPLARVAEGAAALCDDVSLRTPVTGVVMHDGTVTGVRTDDGTKIDCDACVLAIPPKRLSSVLGRPERFDVRGLGQFDVEPIVDVHIWYDRAAAPFDFAALLDSAVQWVFVKGPGYLVCSISAASDLVSLPNTTLVERCDAELRAFIPALRCATLIRGDATRDPEATFVPAPGLQRPGARTNMRNLVIAGAWTNTGWPATMESAVRSGRTAAGLLLHQLEVRPAGSPQRQDPPLALQEEHAHAL